MSERCRDAVTLHLVQKSVFSIDEDGDGRDGSACLPNPEWKLLSRSQKETLLSRLTGLRELHVFVAETGDGPEELMDVLLDVSTVWSRLEKLTLDWRRSMQDPDLLGPIFSHCTRLTDVTMKYIFTNQSVEGLLISLHRQLLKLELEFESDMMADRLACCFSGAVVESLSVHGLSSLVAIMAPHGLPKLRHLSLTGCEFPKYGLTWLAEDLPRLESLSLVDCYADKLSDELSEDSLKLLGQLPTLRSLRLQDIPDVSDSVLDHLSKAPLTELLLAGRQSEFWDSITAEGLLRLTSSCSALRWVTLWVDGEPQETTRTIDCRSDNGKQELLKTSVASYSHCRLSETPGRRQTVGK